MSTGRDPAQELQDLLETITRAVVGNQATVFPAKGRGFIHFEIRCSKDAHSVLRRHHDALRTLMMTAGAARRTRITMQLFEQQSLTAVTKLIEKPSAQLEQLVLTMARALADLPEEVVVFPADGDGFSHYDVRCDNGDVGALIGNRALHANAMRSILSAAGDAVGVRASLQIMARDGND